MQALILDPRSPTISTDALGAIVCEEVKVDGRRLFRKGDRLDEQSVAALGQLDRPIHAVRLDEDDIHEVDAAVALATAIAGPGTRTTKPVQSRVNVRADIKGLLRIDADRILAINRVPDMAVFTLLDRLAVLPDKIVAGVKITPVATRRAHLDEAVRRAGNRAVIEVKPFLHLAVSVISTEVMDGPTRERFRTSVAAKLAWYGAELMGFSDVDPDPDIVAAAIERSISSGASLVLTGGGNTIDPLDPTLVAIRRAGAEFARFGVPAHPGSMFWLAYLGDIPIFNLASCSLYSRATVADVVLPWIMAGERVTSDDLAGLGYGGLLDQDMQFRFPPYDTGGEAPEPA